jgi:uncharacterized protein (DUF302 family)
MHKGNFVEKSFNDKTSKVVEHILKKGFKTKRQIELGETKGKKTNCDFKKTSYGCVETGSVRTRI